MADKFTLVSENAGILDSLQSAGRLVLVVVGAVPILLKLLGAHNFVGLVEYFRGSDGASLLGAVTGLAAIVYGIYKSHKRGSQVASAAPYAPNLALK